MEQTAGKQMQNETQYARVNLTILERPQGCNIQPNNSKNFAARTPLISPNIEGLETTTNSPLVSKQDPSYTHTLQALSPKEL